MKKENIEIIFDERIIQQDESSAELVFPVYTLPLNEFKFREYCRERGIICYLPLKKCCKVNDYMRNGRACHRSMVVLRPMFSSYAFVKMPREEFPVLWHSKAILRILKPSSQERMIQDLRTVRAVEQIGLEQEVEFNPGIREGDHFIIESGIWTGCTGWLKKKGRKFDWTVELEFISQLIRTRIDPSAFKMKRLEE